MKKLFYYVLSAFLLFFIGNVNVFALEIEADDIGNRTYVIGTHMFTRERNQSTGYDGKLTTERLMLASKTIKGNNLSDMIVYYKNPFGIWTNGITGEEIEAPRSFEIEKINEEKILDRVEITGKIYDGTSIDNEVCYKLTTDKKIGDGLEIYSSDSADGEYTLINTNEGYEFIIVSVLDNTKKYFKVRPYKVESGSKIYGGFSETIEIDQTNMSENAQISNMEFGAVSDHIITITVNEAVGDGFVVYYSDSIDGEYNKVAPYEFIYSDPQFINNSVNFALGVEDEGAIKYFKIKTFKDIGTTRVFSGLSNAYGIILQDIEITSKEFHGISPEMEVYYTLTTDKTVGEGLEIYSSDSIDGTYTYFSSTGLTIDGKYDWPQVKVLDNTKKYFKVRGYRGEAFADRIYSGFSEVIEIDQTNMNESAQISNMEFGLIDTDIITLTINEAVGDGFVIFSSDSIDGEYEEALRIDYNEDVFSNNKVNFVPFNFTEGAPRYFKIKTYKKVGTTRVFSELSSAYGIILQDIEITNKTFDGTSIDNKVSYKLTTDKEVGMGVEIYSSDSVDGEYTLINSIDGYDFIRVDILDNTKKYFKVRGYQGETLADRIYSGFSQAIEIDQTNMSEKIEISQIEYGVVDEDVVTLTINEAIGDGFIIYSSDSIDGEYKYEYSYTYSELSSNKVNFSLRNDATGTRKYFKVKAYKDIETTRLFSELSSARELNF